MNIFLYARGKGSDWTARRRSRDRAFAGGICVKYSSSGTQLIAQVHLLPGGGRVVRRCWVNIQCRGVLLIWIRVGQGPTALAVGAGGGCLDIFSLIYHFSFLSPFLWETARYRLKYCLKGPLSPKTTNQHLLPLLVYGFVCTAPINF